MTNAFNSSSSFLTTPSLLDRVRAHDADAWQLLTSLFGPLIFHWLRARGLGEHDAADVLQEVFASIARSLHTFKPGVERGFRGWIWTIARSRLADFYRRRAREAQAIDGSDVWNRLADETARLTDAPDEFTEETHLDALFKRALDLVRAEFENRTWEMFYRCVVGQVPPKEVAEEFGVSAQAVRQAKSRVLRRIRSELGE